MNQPPQWSAIKTSAVYIAINPKYFNSFVSADFKVGWIMWSSLNMVPPAQALYTLFQLATGASRLISKLQWKRHEKVGARSKMSAWVVWCTWRGHDMSHLRRRAALGGREPPGGWSPAAGAGAAGAGAAGLALCAWARRSTLTNHKRTVNSSSGAHPVGKPNTPTEIRVPAEWGGESGLVQGERCDVCRWGMLEMWQ